ncbi:hypothetical protein [Streptacidiphilus cavernicola]|uniref:Leucine rich repeat variant n=1 Tax=Streptacidiphilus cavernicola TaxID=3342716 RepID=A0ABV6W4H2_9ACTN
MIESADEFVQLRLSGGNADYQRIKQEEAPLAVWLEIARDHPDMRFWMAFNRALPEEVIRLLGEDEDWRVRAKIASRRDILEYLSGDDHDAVVSSVASNPGTPNDALVRLASHHWGQVRDRASKQIEERDPK